MSKNLFILVFNLAFLLMPRQAKAQVVINEFLADLPKGEDEDDGEWIELFNKGDHAININGYVLVDAKGYQLVVSEEKVVDAALDVPPKSWAVIKRQKAKLSLNNDEDTITLFSDQNLTSQLDQVSYSDPKEGLSWGRISDGQEWKQDLEPTPGRANQPPPEPTIEPTSTPKTTAKPESKPEQIATPKPIEYQTTQIVPGYESEPEVLGNSTSIVASRSAIASMSVPEATHASQPEENSVVDLSVPSATTKPWWFLGGGISFLVAAGVRGYKKLRLTQYD